MKKLIREIVWRTRGRDTTGDVKTVALNVDDTGYLKSTAWLAPVTGGQADGFLFLDRNYNGQMDGGRELFSNGVVALSERGLAGLRWIDSNYDGCGRGAAQRRGTPQRTPCGCKFNYTLKAANDAVFVVRRAA